MIGPSRARSAGDLTERDGVQKHMPEQIKHELADSLGSQDNIGTHFRGYNGLWVQTQLENGCFRIQRVNDRINIPTERLTLAFDLARREKVELFLKV